MCAIAYAAANKADTISALPAQLAACKADSPFVGDRPIYTFIQEQIHDATVTPLSGLKQCINAVSILVVDKVLE